MIYDTFSYPKAFGFHVKLKLYTLYLFPQHAVGHIIQFNEEWQTPFCIRFILIHFSISCKSRYY